MWLVLTVALFSGRLRFTSELPPPDSLLATATTTTTALRYRFVGANDEAEKGADSVCIPSSHVFSLFSCFSHLHHTPPSVCHSCRLGGEDRNNRCEAILPRISSDVRPRLTLRVFRETVPLTLKISITFNGSFSVKPEVLNLFFQSVPYQIRL